MDDQHEDLLNLVLGVLRSWNDPLIHLASEVQRIKEAPDTILWKAVEIEEQNKRLLEGMEKIVGRVSIRSFQSFQPLDVKKPHTVVNKNRNSGFWGKRGIQHSWKVLRFSYNSFCCLVISKEAMWCDLPSIIQHIPKPASRESIIIRTGNLHFIFKHLNLQIFVGCFCFFTSTYLHVHISLFIHVCIHIGIVYSFQKWIMCLKLFLKSGLLQRCGTQQSIFHFSFPIILFLQNCGSDSVLPTLGGLDSKAVFWQNPYSNTPCYQ